MKFRKKISFLLTLLLVIPLYISAAEETPIGTYVPKIVVDAPWGETNAWDNKRPSEPGKIGFGYNSQGIECGPTGFTVAPDGNIYIADILNHRTQIFDSNGFFLTMISDVSAGSDAGMCIDDEGNMYTGHFYTVNPYVRKFDCDGNAVRTYGIVKDSSLETDAPYKWGGNGAIYCDDSGRIFINFKHGVLQLGTKDSVFSGAQQKASLMPGLFGYTSNVPDMKKGALMYKLLGEYSGPGYMLGMDRNYVYSWIQDKENPDFKIVDKTDYEGNWIASYRLNLKQMECQLLTVFNMGRTIVFDKGNIYVFCTDKEGVKIIKFSPVEGTK